MIKELTCDKCKKDIRLDGPRYVEMAFDVKHIKTGCNSLNGEKNKIVHLCGLCAYKFDKWLEDGDAKN